MSRTYLGVVSVFMTILLSCNYERPDAEGVIYYDVSFPFLEGNILKNVFPEEMKLYFKDDMMYGEVRSLGGIVKTSFISDNQERRISQMLKNYGEKFYVELDEDGVEDFLSDQPAVRFEETSDSIDIAGYRCAITVANFMTDSVPAIMLYHTNKIDIKNPNWYTQFAEMPEVLLGYEVEQFGMRMKLIARQVIKKEVSDEQFIRNEKYQPINSSELKIMMKGMLDDFLGD